MAACEVQRGGAVQSQLISPANDMRRCAPTSSDTAPVTLKVLHCSLCWSAVDTYVAFTPRRQTSKPNSRQFFGGTGIGWADAGLAGSSSGSFFSAACSRFILSSIWRGFRSTHRVHPKGISPPPPLQSEQQNAPVFGRVTVPVPWPGGPEYHESRSVHHRQPRSRVRRPLISIHRRVFRSGVPHTENAIRGSFLVIYPHQHPTAVFCFFFGA